MLSASQQRVVEKVMAGRNVFVTGGAGVGKSFLIQHLVGALRKTGRMVVVSASTGVAATLVAGRTLHATFGMGLAKDPLPILTRIALKSRKLVQRWRSMDVLIVDEVSMLNPEFFTKVERVVAEMRGSPDLAFGGLQVVLVGDFFQLPPVPERGVPSLFVFETETWSRVVDETVELTEIFRQENDSPFAQMLARARTGSVTMDDIEMLLQRKGAAPDVADGVVPTHMHARRTEVSDINLAHLQALDAATERVFARAVSSQPAPGVRDPDGIKRWVREVERNMQAPDSLVLRVGAQVMMLVNRSDQRLVNGSRGVVVGFTGDGLPRVQFGSGCYEVAPHTWTAEQPLLGTVAVTQVPLQLAWAITVHKSQGLGLDAAEMCLDRSVFEYGQAYVALSRLRTLEGLSLTGFDHRVIRAHPRVVDFYKGLRGADDVAVAKHAAAEASAQRAVFL